MDILSIFAVLAAIVFIGFFAELIFQKFGIPDVLILIFIGILLSSVLGWTDSATYGEAATLFTTFALIFILFQGAININFNMLIRSLSKTLKLTLSSFVTTVLIVTAIAFLMGYEPLAAMAIGTILAGTSSAVVIPLVKSVDITEKYGLVLKLESALSDVLCIIGTITVLEIIATGKVVASGIFKSVLSSFSLAIIVGVVVGILWIILLHMREELSKAYMLTIATVIALYAFVESPWVEGSGAIAALAFGLVLGNSKIFLDRKEQTKTSSGEEKNSTTVLSASAKSFYSEISFFVKTFFFVYLGTLIDFSDPITFVYGAVLTLGIYLIRPVAVAIIFRKDDMNTKEKTFLQVLIPKGLAAAVLAGVAVQSGLLDGESAGFTNLIITVIFFSIVLTSVLVFITEKGWFRGFFPKLNKEPEKKPA